MTGMGIYFSYILQGQLTEHTVMKKLKVFLTSWLNCILNWNNIPFWNFVSSWHFCLEKQLFYIVTEIVFLMTVSLSSFPVGLPDSFFICLDDQLKLEGKTYFRRFRFFFPWNTAEPGLILQPQDFTSKCISRYFRHFFLTCCFFANVTSLFNYF